MNVYIIALLVLLLPAVVQPAIAGVDWSLHGTNWQEGQCASRDLASPINLDAIDAKPSARTAIGYKYLFSQENGAPLTTKVKVSNDGGAISVDLADKGVLSTDSGVHALVRVDLRAPAEHTFRGHRAKMEVQLVHRHSASGNQAIVSVLFDDSAAAGAAAKLKYALVQGVNGYGEDEDEGDVEDAINPDRHDSDVPRVSETRYVDEAAIENVHKLAEFASVAEKEQNMRQKMNARRMRNLKRYNKAHGIIGLHGRLRKTSKRKAATLLDFVTAGDGLPAVGSDVEHEVASADLGAFLEKLVGPGKDYFQYAGAQTLPPCTKATWFVRRQVGVYANVGAIATKLDKMTDGAGGNFRALMPKNQRLVDVINAVKMDGLSMPNAPKVVAPEGVDPTNLVFKGDKYSDAAMTIAQAAAAHARDIDYRLQSAANERVKFLRAHPFVSGAGPYIAPDSAEEAELKKAVMDNGADAATNIVKQLGAKSAAAIATLR